MKYRKGELNHLSEDDIWSAKHLYDSAYHPDTGEGDTTKSVHSNLCLWLQNILMSRGFDDPTGTYVSPGAFNIDFVLE